MNLLKPIVLSISVISFSANLYGDESTLRPFKTDGCSLFPDRNLISKDDWCHCCLAHDLAYWKGGTVQERKGADRALKACVLRLTGNAALSELMYVGVKTGGGPYFYTPYRWGYGWSYGRSYSPLSQEEQNLAARLEGDYRKSNPTLQCH